VSAIRKAGLGPAFFSRRISKKEKNDTESLLVNPSSTAPADGLTRRQFLRVGVAGSLALSAISTTALLTGCSSPPVANGYKVLRDHDLKVLRALVPVLLAGEMPEGEARNAAVEETLHTLDSFLTGTSSAGQKQLAQLLDLMHMPLTRYTIVGLSADWDEAAPADIAAFLEHWRASRFETLRAGYGALTQMLNMMWYLQPRSWAAIGYIPPHVVV
jgi:hypothetical protein